ncbi:hypothetical protein V5799_005721 [Amblyomma americanum]|uniref:Uncharacterized protein n=1 Tax=Amblyomma americanum TaxID=6943 RepID=A0AAQ4DYF8_AMBAM
METIAGSVKLKISLYVLFLLFFGQSGYRLSSAIADVVERQKTNSLDYPVGNIVNILGFTASVLVIPSMFVALSRGLKYLLIIAIAWFVVVSSFETFGPANTQRYYGDATKDKIYIIWVLMLCYLEMYAKKTQTAEETTTMSTQ